MRIFTSIASDQATAELLAAQGLFSCPSCDSETRVGNTEVAAVHGEIIRTGPGAVLTAIPVQVLHDDDCPYFAGLEAARAEKDAERATWPEECR